MPGRKANVDEIAETPTVTRVPAKARARISRQEQAGRGVAAGVASARTGAKPVQLTIFDYAAGLGISLFPDQNVRPAPKPRRRRKAKAS